MERLGSVSSRCARARGVRARELTHAEAGSTLLPPTPCASAQIGAHTPSFSARMRALALSARSGSNSRGLEKRGCPSPTRANCGLPGAARPRAHARPQRAAHLPAWRRHGGGCRAGGAEPVPPNPLPQTPTVSHPLGHRAAAGPPHGQKAGPPPRRGRSFRPDAGGEAAGRGRPRPLPSCPVAPRWRCCGWESGGTRPGPACWRRCGEADREEAAVRDAAACAGPGAEAASGGAPAAPGQVRHGSRRGTRGGVFGWGRGTDPRPRGATRRGVGGRPLAMGAHCRGQDARARVERRPAAPAHAAGAATVARGGDARRRGTPPALSTVVGNWGLETGYAAYSCVVRGSRGARGAGARAQAGADGGEGAASSVSGPRRVRWARAATAPAARSPHIPT